MKTTTLKTNLMSVCTVLVIAATAAADGEHEHRVDHPEIDTPHGFTRWMPRSQLDEAISQGPTVDLRPDGSLKFYWQQGDFKSGEALTWGHKTLFWRTSNTEQLLFADECVYIPEDEPDFCTDIFYGVVDGKPQWQADGTFIGNQDLMSYVSTQPGYIRATPDADENISRIVFDGMWFSGDSAEMRRGPLGLGGDAGIWPVDGFLGADRLTLVSDESPSAVPEPSALALLLPALLTLGRIRRGA